MGDCEINGRHSEPVRTAFVSLFGLFLLASLSTVSAARPVRYTSPRFLDTPNNITAVVGSDVVLPCSVQNLGTKSVIWKKVTHLNPITIGDYIFAPESRYTIIRNDPYMTMEQAEYHEKENPRWNLQIKDVGKEDAGIYECQISTKEDIMRVVTLHVVEDKSRRKAKKTGIQLSGTDFVEKGSTIDINCTATSIDYRPKGVDWFKDGTMIKNGGRVSIIEYLENDMNILQSHLAIHRSVMEDAGTYVCRFSVIHVESVKVIVLNTDSSNRRRETDFEGLTNGIVEESSHTGPLEKDDGDGDNKNSSTSLHSTTHLHVWCACLLILIAVYRTTHCSLYH